MDLAPEKLARLDLAYTRCFTTRTQTLSTVFRVEQSQVDFQRDTSSTSASADRECVVGVMTQSFLDADKDRRARETSAREIINASIVRTHFFERASIRIIIRDSTARLFAMIKGNSTTIEKVNAKLNLQITPRN